MRTSGLSSLAISATTVLVGFLILFPLAMLLYGSLLSSQPGLPGHLTLANYIDAYGDGETYLVFLNWRH
jgi:hypothetical protein